MRLRSFLFFLSLIAICPLKAQDSYLFSHLGARHGLLSNEVTSIQQDKRGYIWIATPEGLQRFDGHRFLTMSHSSTGRGSIPDDKILWMRITPRTNRIWILFENNKMGYVDPESLEFRSVAVEADSDRLDNANGGLFVDPFGNITLFLAGDSAYTYNAAAQLFSPRYNPFKIPAGWKPYWLFCDSTTASYWIGCDHGLVKYNNITQTMSTKDNNPDHDPIIEGYRSIVATIHPTLDQTGKFWVESWAANASLSFYSYDPKTKELKDWAPSLGKLMRYAYFEISNVMEQQDGTIWLSGSGILAYKKKNETQFRIVRNNQPGEFAIRFDMTYQVFEDREHNVWIGTNRGLFRFNPSAQMFHSIDEKSLDEDTTYSFEVSDVLQTKRGEVLASTWGGATLSFDSSLQAIHLDYIKSSRKLGEGMSWAMHERANGDIWKAHQGGIIFISHPATGKTERLQPPVFAGITIRQITEDRNGNLWFGTHGGAVVKWDSATRIFTRLQHFHSTIYKLVADSNDHIWACTEKLGLFEINAKDGSLEAHYSAHSPEGQKLMSMAVYDMIQYNDSLYIICSGGLNVLNIHNAKIHPLVPPNGLPSSTIFGIAKDNAGYIWIATQNGLCNINMKNQVLTVFNESDGIEGASFSIASMSKLRDGRIAVGTSHNFIVFDPSAISQTDLTPPNVEITGFSLMNKWLSVDSLSKQPKIELGHDQRAFTIGFSTLTYQNNYGISYQLVGLDKDWVIARNWEAVYNYVPPGEYTFRIKAENAVDQESRQITEMKIVVQNAFWESRWFYAVLILLAATLLFWIDSERIKRKEAIQKMRSDISGNLHEEINNTLQDINVLSEIARIKAEKEPEVSKNYIHEIQHKSHQMIIAMDDMLWSIEPGNDDMKQTIARVKEFANSLRNRHDAIIELHTDEKLNSLNLDMKSRHELMIIYKLAMRLLVEEKKASQLIIQLDYVNSSVQLTIFAEGLKTNIQSNQEIRMLAEMKTRAAEVNGNLEIQSDEKGTGIIFIVKA